MSFLTQAGHFVLMAFEHDQPVGMLYGYLLDRIDGRRMGLIYDLEVVEAHRRRGHGRRLLQSALDLSRVEGALTVWLTTGRDNDAGRVLYHEAGAEEIDDVLFQWVLSSTNAAALTCVSSATAKDRRVRVPSHARPNAHLSGPRARYRPPPAGTGRMTRWLR